MHPDCHDQNIIPHSWYVVMLESPIVSCGIDLRVESILYADTKMCMFVHRHPPYEEFCMGEERLVPIGPADKHIVRCALSSEMSSFRRLVPQKEDGVQIRYSTIQQDVKSGGRSVRISSCIGLAGSGIWAP